MISKIPLNPTQCTRPLRCMREKVNYKNRSEFFITYRLWVFPTFSWQYFSSIPNYYVNAIHAFFVSTLVSIATQKLSTIQAPSLASSLSSLYIFFISLIWKLGPNARNYRFWGFSAILGYFLEIESLDFPDITYRAAKSRNRRDRRSREATTSKGKKCLKAKKYIHVFR